MLFEMTNDYRIILPLMLTTVTATFFSRLLFRQSIYTLKLSRRGVHLKEGKDIDVMHEVTVAEAMTTDLITVHLSMPLETLAREFDRTHHHGFTVVDDNDCLEGVVTIQDLKKALESGSIEGKTVTDIATLERVLVAYPDQPMGEALRKLAARDVGRLPVIERGDESRVMGALRRNDIIRAYNIAITKRADHMQRNELKRLTDLDDARFLQVEIPPKSPVVGKKVSEISLPSDCLIISIMRGQKTIIAHGYSTLQAQDQLTVFANEECVLEVQQCLTSELVEDDCGDEELDGGRVKE